MGAYNSLILELFCDIILSLGMTDFDRTLTFFNMQDELCPSHLVKLTRASINANAFSKVKAAFAQAFAQPALALA